MTSLPIADRWFELKRIRDDITLLWEPHVVLQYLACAWP